MSQAEVPKLLLYAATGSQADKTTVSKLVIYMVMRPSDEGDTSNRQGHVHTQIVRRPRR